MLENLLIDKQEASDIVSAVLEYNGKYAQVINFLDGEGRPVDIAWIQVVCAGQPLSVRVAPDKEQGVTALEKLNEEVLTALLNRSEDTMARRMAEQVYGGMRERR